MVDIEVCQRTKRDTWQPASNGIDTGSRHALAGSGIGWVDVHLLCSAALSQARLWTLDRRLRATASRLDLHA
jgi:hypothetical protein